MNRLFRIALTGMLLVAVPLQGYAARGMLACDAGQPAGTVAQHDHRAPEQHASGHAHDHGHAAHGIADVAGDAWSLPDVVHGTCSLCSSVCSAPALPAAPILSRAETPHALVAMEGDGADPLCGGTRLERPPRLTLA